jgi:ribosomal protein S1
MATNRIPLTLAVTLAFSMGSVGTALAVTTVGSTNTTVRPTESETVTNGTITSIDAGRGVLAVSGRVIHFTPKSVMYSDDRHKPPHKGLEGLKPGDKVTVRSVMRDGGNQAIQIVVKD